jgi:hypothetical protein
VLKKLLALVVVLLIAGTMAVPAFAQTVTADLNVPYGSEQWLANEFGIDPNLCTTIAQNPSTQQAWVEMYGDAITSYCGW